MRQLQYTKCAVICHGLSECQIAKYIKSNLHLKMELFSKDNGHSSIQITGLMDYLNNKRFTNLKAFSESCSIEYNKRKLIDFKLFIIMDCDDCSQSQKNSFINKEMFNGHPLFDYIYPIVNTPNLENVLVKAGILVKKIKKDEKGDYYFKTFPIHDGPLSLDSYNEIVALRDKLSNVCQTNLEEFLTYCLNLVK